MQAVTLVGLRQRTVGSAIENVYTGSAHQQRLPTLTSSSTKFQQPPMTDNDASHPVSSADTAIRVQQLYDKNSIGNTGRDIENMRKPTGSSSDGDEDKVPSPQSMKTKLPPISSGVSSNAKETIMKIESALPVKRIGNSVALPMSPETAMKHYMHKLSAFEQHEIFDYQKVFVLSLYFVFCILLKFCSYCKQFALNLCSHNGINS